MSKSPFASPETHTYTYPEPFEEDDERIDPGEVGEGHWLKLRIPRSKADVDRVADYTPSMVIVSDNGDGAKLEQRITRGNSGIFELLAEEWSFDAKPSAVNFARLDIWSGDWITVCLGDAVARGTARDYAKKAKSPEPAKASSGKRASSPTTPAPPEPEESA